MIYKSEIKFFIILEIKKLEELSKNTYVEIIQKPNHISILIKSRISNSQKDNWLDLPKLVYQCHREICGIFLFKRLFLNDIGRKINKSFFRL